MDHDDLLDAVLAAARGAGATSADALFSERTSLSLSWRLGALEDLERKDAREIGLRVMVGRRVATTATTRTDLATLRALAEDAVAAARLLPEDPWVGLAEPAQLATRWPELDLADEGEPTLDSLQAAAAAAEDAARACARHHQFRRSLGLLVERPHQPRRQQRLSRLLPPHPPRPRRHRAGGQRGRHAARLRVSAGDPPCGPAFAREHRSRGR